MASRLDRLFILLETGSTSCTRKTAAAQLGPIIKLHPGELTNLLSRLGLCLKSNSWETRVAAGWGLEAVLTEWKEQLGAHTNGTDLMIKEEADTDTHIESKKWIKEEHNSNSQNLVKEKSADLDWASLLKDLLNPSLLLMGSEGSTYDRVSKLDEKKQKELITSKLVGVELSSVIDMGWVGELAQPGVEVNSNLSSNSATSKDSSGDNLSQSSTNDKLSSRELNLAKRRAKRPRPRDPEEPVKKPKLVQVESLKEWVQLLLKDLFSLDWEWRHGASTGLREFLRIFGGGPKWQIVWGNEESYKPWLISIITTLLKILAFDRFGDFVSDQVVAPVRETTAQCLGALFPHMDKQMITGIVTILVELLDQQVWEVKHGGLLAVKYLFAVREDLTSLTLPRLLRPILQCLSFESCDDVVNVAASCLIPIVDQLTFSVSAEEVQQLVSVLWSCLGSLDDLSSASNSIMQLLAGVLKWPEARRELSSLDTLLPRLFPFLHHKSTSVRHSTLLALQKLILTPSITPPSALTLQLTLRHLFQLAFLELNESILGLVPDVWVEMIRSSEKSVLAEAANPMLSLWLWFAMLHPGMAVPDGLMLEHRSTEEKTRITSSSPCVIKIASTRVTLSKLISYIYPFVDISSFIIPHLQSNSSVQRTVSSLVISYLQQPTDQLTSLPPVLNSNLTSPIYYEEISSTFSKLQSECREFLTALTKEGIQLGFLESDWLSMDKVQYLAGVEVKERIQGNEGLEEKGRGVQGLWQQAMGEWRDLNVLTLSCTASAVINIALPPKLNPLIKPLMDSISSESNSIYQSHSASCLIRLMDSVKEKPQPNSKIIGKLLGFLTSELESEEPTERVDRRGAKMVLEGLCKLWGERVKSSRLWELSVGVLLGEDPQAEQLKIALLTLPLISPHLHSSLNESLYSLLPKLTKLLEPPSTRSLASKCFSSFTKLMPEKVMPFVVTELLPLMKEGEGPVQAVNCIVEEMDLGILPWLLDLVVPVLGLLSSQSTPIRLLASSTFACLIRLLPLEQVSGNSPNFLQQLLHPSSIPDYLIKVDVKAQLRPYQVKGVTWLQFLNRYGLNGILCDDMGLGKTLMTIILLAEEQVANKGSSEVPRLSIVICPPTLTGHWVYEISKFVSSDLLNPLHYHGAPAERFKIQQKIQDHDLIVASYDIVRNDLDFFSGLKFNYCVLDEGHMIKNGKTKISLAIKQLKATHRLILTGTPIQNNVLELWSLFDFLMPGFLGTEKAFNNKFGRPILQARDAKSSEKEQEKGALAMEALHRQTLPFLLRRLKGDVLQDLPPKITQDYYCNLSPLQSQLYEDFARTRAHRSLKDSLKEDLKHSHIFQALQYLRKVCNHPKLVLGTGHPQYEAIRGQVKDMNDIELGAKLPALRQLLLDCGLGTASTVSSHRALIFCQLRSMLDIVEKDLLQKHLPSVTYLRLDGSVPAGQRHSLVHRFNSDVSIDVLLLTTQVGGLGLNLTGADTVIFVEHDWNPMRDLQAMDRAHRIGQKKVVNVYRLITRGTLEEKIMGLQKFKLMTANTVISGDNKGLETMGTEQLLDLFTLNPAPIKTASGEAEEDGLIGAYNKVLESVPELWEESLYDDEYDLSSFIRALK